MRRLDLVLLLIAVTLAAALLWPRGDEAPPSPFCRVGDPLSNVYHRDRLKVRKRCSIADGVVEGVKFEAYDGDVHIDLRTAQTKLVVEVIPSDRAMVVIPQPGSHVRVVGPLVDDLEHGWPEIHPAWWISAGRLMPASPREVEREASLLRDDD